MRAHIAALFAHDGRGRMTRVNEPNGAPAPRFFLGRTAHGVEWRVRDDLVDPTLLDDLERACEREAPLESAVASAETESIYDELLARSSPVERRWAGPAFCFPLHLLSGPHTVFVTETNAALLRPHLESWLPDITLGHPMLAAIVDGSAVAVCASVRVTPAAHEAGIETAPEFRGRGYGPIVASAWARAVREAGAIPLYSTSWENAASRAVARKLDLRLFGADYHIT